MNISRFIKNRKQLLLAVALVCATALLFSCGEDRTHEYEEKTVACHQLQELMAEWYLWNESISDLDWQQYFAKPSDFITKLTAHSNSDDKWSYCLLDTLESDPLPWGNFNHVNSYGMDVRLMGDPTGETSRQYARVVSVFENSPAYRCGIRRNDFIGQVDNNKMASTVIKNLVNGRAHSLVVGRIGLSDDNTSFRWVSTDTLMMEKSERVEVPTVLASRMFDAETGYIMLTNLSDAESIVPALIRLKAYPLTSLIVDLRLCNRGDIECVHQVAKMIGSGSGVFLRTFWNKSKAAEYNHTYSIDGAAEFKLFFITGPYTQGAAEWLIHGLKSMSPDDVVVVGTETRGQNVMLKAIPSDYQFTIHPAVAYVADGDGNYEYTKGITPDEPVVEYDYAELYPYGNIYEVMIQYILTQLL